MPRLVKHTNQSFLLAKMRGFEDFGPLLRKSLRGFSPISLKKNWINFAGLYNQRPDGESLAARQLSRFEL